MCSSLILFLHLMTIPKTQIQWNATSTDHFRFMVTSLSKANYMFKQALVSDIAKTCLCWFPSKGVGCKDSLGWSIVWINAPWADDLEIWATYLKVPTIQLLWRSGCLHWCGILHCTGSERWGILFASSHCQIFPQRGKAMGNPTHVDVTIS